MHDVAVELDLHQLVDGHAAVLAHPTEVVAAEVDEHHVLGALLLVGEQLLRDPAILLGARAARAGARDRLGADVAPAHRQQRLGARAGDLEVAEVQEVHVGARVDRPQAAVDRERLDRHRGRPALGGHDLEGVAGVDVLDRSARPCPRTARGACSSWNSGISPRCGRGRARRAGPGPASAPRTSAIVRAAVA